MSIIAQQTLFVWDEIENLGDLERLRVVIEYMPDEELMQKLEKQRGKGRNDYPVRAMWNSILAGVVYQHPSIESLRRELSRNGLWILRNTRSTCLGIYEILKKTI